MRNNTLRLAVAIILILTSASAMAATSYISDQLSVNLRRGPSTGYGITKLVQAGTKVQTLSETNGWTKVRTSNGTVGYVLTRFLSDQPAARDRIATIEASNAKLKNENSQLHAALAEALHGSRKMGELKSQLIAENKSLKSQLQQVKQISANAIKLNKQNQQYRQKLLVAQSKVERLRSENEALQSRREGMKIGALILIVGVIVGLVLPMFRRRRKNSWIHSDWGTILSSTSCDEAAWNLI